MIDLTFIQVYNYGLVVQNRLDDQASTAIEKSLNGTARYAHHLTRLRLIIILQITETQGFKLVQGKQGDADILHRDSLGLEHAISVVPSAAALFFRSGHISSIYFVHMHIMNIGRNGPVVKGIFSVGSINHLAAESEAGGVAPDNKRPPG